MDPGDKTPRLSTEGASAPGWNPRALLSKVVRGGHSGPSSYRWTRWLFLRCLGLVYLIAFLSVWVQIEGLIGSDGILPVGEFLERVWQNIGSEGYRKLPTLLWLGHGDGVLHFLCGSGVALSLLLIVGVAPVLSLLLLWVLYLSLTLGGQAFLSFQWDTLLLETGFMALFFAPAQLRPAAPWNQPEPSRLGLWLLRFLLFKLMFLSGIVKLLSLDRAWWDLTALDYHYFTQPLPIWTAWYASQLPAWFQKLSVLFMFLVELVAPLLIFTTRRPRLIGCAAMVLLQLLIALTGNYCFFNLLTVVLCITLLDDACLVGLVPHFLRSRLRGEPAAGADPPVRTQWEPVRRVVTRLAPIAMAVLVTLISSMTFLRELVRSAPRTWEVRRRRCSTPPTGSSSAGDDYYLLGWSDPFRTINGYGLFRSMTTTRPEIVIEGSHDGQTWLEYGFRFKPGDVTRRPRLIAPHQPRLDWQMWFAALNPRRAGPWLETLMLRLLEGSPEALELMGENPFPDRPPRLVRLAYYRYEFAGRDEAGGKVWWKRERLGELTAALSLDYYRDRTSR